MTDEALSPMTYSLDRLTNAQVRRICVNLKLQYGFRLSWRERLGEAWGRWLAKRRRRGSIGR